MLYFQEELVLNPGMIGGYHKFVFIKSQWNPRTFSKVGKWADLLSVKGDLLKDRGGIRPVGWERMGFTVTSFQNLNRRAWTNCQNRLSPLGVGRGRPP
jgi:hypothetical protein